MEIRITGAGAAVQSFPNSPPNNASAANPSRNILELDCNFQSICSMSQLLAYIGPGAGIAFAGSFLSLIVGFFLTVGALAAWPFRALWAGLRGKRGYRHAKIQRLIFLGLDGLDPRLTERFMAEGKLPNLSRLKQQGSFHRLRTTCPALSPVAWSTFATGVNPGKHNIFDFRNRSLKSYIPELAPSKVRPAGRFWQIGRFRIPLAPLIENRRKSRTFWNVLGEHAISSTILRVPITFPPEKFNGRLLSAMCTPDLRGTEGSFSQFTTRVEQPQYGDGNRYPLRRSGNCLIGSLWILWFLALSTVSALVFGRYA
jgi:hypothetical protein